MVNSASPRPDEPASEGARPAVQPELERWLAEGEAATPHPDDWVDPDLLRLSRRPALLQLLLVLLVMAIGAVFAVELRAELLYFFASHTPIDVGAAEDLAQRLSQDPDYLARLPDNVYAHVSGVPERRAVAGDRQFSQLAGAPVYVESERQDIGANPVLRGVQPRLGPQDTRNVRYYVDTVGRLRHFEDLGSHYGGLVAFYRDGYDAYFCGQQATRRQQDFRALAARDLAESLGRQPTRAEIDAALPCQHAILIEAGVAPDDHVWYLVIYAFMALLELGGLWYAVRWLRALRAWRR